MALVRIAQVEPLDAFRVRLVLTDGSSRDVDLEPYLKGRMFEAIRANRDRFLEFSVDAELGTIVWPNGADICPDVLVHGRSPASQEEASR